MSATTLPAASVSVNARATSSGAGDGYIAIITPVGTLYDGVPRLYASGKAAYDAHGYSPGISYAAMHCNETRKPVLIVGIPIATAGEATAVSDDDGSGGDATGTSVVTVTEGSDGTLTDLDCKLTVMTGGTIGTDDIVLKLTCDGSVTEKTIRLGTADSYAIPDVGLTINFAAGTLVADEYYEWTASGPMYDSDGLATARGGLAEASYDVRTWLVDTEPTSLTNTLADAIATQAGTYASSNERFILARTDTEDLTESTWAAEAAAQAITYTDTNQTEGRLSLGLGRRRKLCPITGWSFRRGPSWAASLREYRKDLDVHNTTWWRAYGPLAGWSIDDDDTEHDERSDGGALAGRFTCFTTLVNGSGVYIAKDVTRASDSSTLFLPNNVQVTNVACTIIQEETTRLLGQSVILNDDGTIDANQAVDLEETVNAALKRGLLQEKVAGRGPRASAARWTVSRDDDLTGASATLTGVLTLNLRGVISQVSTTVRVY